MRLCRFNEGKYGIVRGDVVDDVTAVVDRVVRRAGDGVHGDPVVARLDEIKAAIDDPETYQAYLLAAVKLLSPVANPSKLVAVPTNYRAHVAEMAADKTVSNPGLPKDIGKAGLFLKANSALVGPSASDVPEERALDHVAGYTLGLDMTLRGPEDRSFRKSIDTYAVLGPWLVTADEIA